MKVLYVAFRVKFLRTGQHSFCLLEKISKILVETQVYCIHESLVFSFIFYLLLQKDYKLPKKPYNIKVRIRAAFYVSKQSGLIEHSVFRSSNIQHTTEVEGGWWNLGLLRFLNPDWNLFQIQQKRLASQSRIWWETGLNNSYNSMTKYIMRTNIENCNFFKRNLKKFKKHLKLKF